jgi:hypothetical protein
VTEDVGAAHGVVGGCIAGRDSKSGGTLGLGDEIDSGWKPGCNTPGFQTIDCTLIVVINHRINQIPKFYLNSIQIQRSGMYLNFNSNPVTIQAKWST